MNRFISDALLRTAKIPNKHNGVRTCFSCFRSLIPTPISVWAHDWNTFRQVSAKVPLFQAIPNIPGGKKALTLRFTFRWNWKAVKSGETSNFSMVFKQATHTNKPTVAQQA